LKTPLPESLISKANSLDLYVSDGEEILSISRIGGGFFADRWMFIEDGNLSFEVCLSQRDTMNQYVGRPVSASMQDIYSEEQSASALSEEQALEMLERWSALEHFEEELNKKDAIISKEISGDLIFKLRGLQT
jgi:hypothetical protein